MREKRTNLHLSLLLIVTIFHTHQLFISHQHLGQLHFTVCSLQGSVLSFLHFQVFLPPPGKLFWLFSLVCRACFFSFHLLLLLYPHFFTAILLHFKIFKSITDRKKWGSNIFYIHHIPTNQLVYNMQEFSLKKKKGLPNLKLQLNVKFA